MVETGGTHPSGIIKLCAGRGRVKNRCWLLRRDRERAVLAPQFSYGNGPTVAGAVFGTYAYMSPEQHRGKDVDARTDIFAAGAVCYELLAYEPAFPGSVAEVIDHVLRRDPEPLSRLRPDIDPQLESIVVKAMVKDAKRRFQDIDEMRRQLARVRKRLQTSLDSVGYIRPTTTFVPHTPKPSSRRSPGAGSHEDSMRRAIAEVDAARREFDEGNISLALERLEQFRPSNAMVEEALASLRERADEIYRQEERESTIARGLQAAADALNRREYALAIEAADRVLAVDERNTRALDLRRRARMALEEERRRQEFDQRAREAIAQAVELFESDQEHAALDLLNRFQPPHPDVVEQLSAFRAEMEAAAERLAQENRQRADSLVKQGARSLASEEVDDANAAADDALRLVPGHAGALELRKNVSRTRATLRQRAEANRRAEELVRSSRAQLLAGNRKRAIAALQEFSRPHPLVTEALRELTRELTELERREQEQRRAQQEQEQALAAEQRAQENRRRAGWSSRA